MAPRRKNDSLETQTQPQQATGRKRKPKGDEAAEQAARAQAGRDQSVRQSTAQGLHAFTVDFFTHFGAPPELLDGENPQGALRVELTEPLARHFGAQAMTLAFQRVEPGSDQQLVAHGSKALDAMLSWIDLRGAATVRRLPLRHASSEALMQAVRPRNAGIAGLKLAESREPVYVFYWRITYRADDKREELFLVALDAEGLPVAMGQPEELAGRRRKRKNAGMAWLRAALEASEPFAVEVASPADEPLGGTNSASASLAENGDRGESARFQSLPGIPVMEQPVAAQPATGMAVAVKLPPVTQLVRLAEQARKYATWHADTRCAKHEAEILPRLYKIANRLTGYYEQQIEELRSSQDGSARERALQDDLARKIAEEVENHRLRVHLALCGYQILYTPVASAEMRITDGKREAALRVRMDRFTGVLQRPHCHACDKHLSEVVLCRNGHLACDDCLRQCETCMDVLCATCGVEACTACGKQNCATCGIECRACGGRACAVHLSRCPVCFDEVCHSCQEACAECGERQCRSHLRADAVREADGSTRLVCANCAVRCAGCKQYSARIGACELSGQRFCRNCLVTCTRCKRTVGPGFYGLLKSGRPVCRECTHICEGCQRPGESSSQCAACGGECCENCRGKCDVCGDTFCAQHYARAEGCNHVVCDTHARQCHIGRESVCTLCNVACAICEQDFCAKHSAPCTICGKYYCRSCVDSESGVCDTCGSTVLSDLPMVDLLTEPCAELPDVKVLAPQATWRKVENRDSTLYFGVNPRQERIVLIVRAKPNGGKYVTSRRLTWIDLDALIAYRKSKRKQAKVQD